MSAKKKLKSLEKTVEAQKTQIDSLTENFSILINKSIGLEKQFAYERVKQEDLKSLVEQLERLLYDFLGGDDIEREKLTESSSGISEQL